MPLRILYEKYGDCLTESNLIKVRGLLVEPASNNYLLAERDIYLENPEIKIRVRQEGTRPCPTVICTFSIMKSKTDCGELKKQAPEESSNLRAGTSGSSIHIHTLKSRM